MNLGTLLVALLAIMCQASGLAASASDRAAPSLSVSAGRVELVVAGQKLVFQKGPKGFGLTTCVRDGEQWRPCFDAARPLLSGPHFDDLPLDYHVVENVDSRKSVEFTGRHANPSYAWTLRVSAEAGNPLFRFRITCRLREPLALTSPQPVVALWTRRNDPAVHVDQGPDSIYGPAGIPHGYGFPAAYVWDNQVEAAVFFDMTPMRWMQRNGVARFHDVRIMTRRDGDAIGLGMHFKRLSGHTIPAGDMEIDFSLYQGVRAAKPTTLAALDTMTRIFAPLHPSAAPWPNDQVTGQSASWDRVATETIRGLMQPSTMAEIAAPWRDSPVELVAPQEKMVVHPATPQPGPEQVAAGWDFSTVNNHLTPWLLLARIRRDTPALSVALRKAAALPRFYDPRAGLIRHGTRQPNHVGDLEMSWQDLFFHVETLRAASAAGPEAFDPAVAGRFLLAASGLRTFAHNVDNVLPQWFDPYTKQPVIQNDMPRLGIVREPWQNGSYAWLMLTASDITGDRDFLQEARRAIDALMERMRFRVKNDVYDRTCSDPGDFPVTELFGNAYGIAAAHRLYKATGEAKYLRYSRDFLNTLLRLTPWYEDETDLVSRELHSTGLFFPHGGAHVVTPWETAEAHLMLVWVMKHDPESPLRRLLLKLANLNRTNAFWFYPAFWTPPVRAHDGAKRSGPEMYFPVEPFYSLEGEGGHRGPTAAYMASLGLWNDWLFEALAAASDRRIMVLNLDSMEDYQAALEGIERQFVVYNPTSERIRFTVRFNHLLEARYEVRTGSRTGTVSAEQLRKGLPVTLSAGEERRVVVRTRDYQQAVERLALRRDAENTLIRAYAAIQKTGSATGEQVAGFHEAMKEYIAGRYGRAHQLAAPLVN